MCSLVIIVDSEATGEIEMTKIPRAISPMIGYLMAFNFHQPKILNSFAYRCSSLSFQVKLVV